MDPLPRFELFPSAFDAGVFEITDTSCDVCKRRRGMLYTGPQYSARKESDGMRCCPWCIADGSASRLGLTFNTPYIDESSPNTSQLSREDRDLFESRTPGFISWQGNLWLSCCGRACVYLGEADSADILGRWASVVPTLFESMDHDLDEQREIVADIRRGGPICAYVFQCRNCARLKGYWDCD